jgi:1,4-dihydroxy-2-naphthoyl-CoA hydrolase
MSVMTERDIGALIPLAKTIGIEVSSAEPTKVVGTMPWREDLCTTMTVLHGGALMAFADTLGAVCASLNLPEGAITTTIESKTNFFRAVTEGVVTGTSVPLHVGRRTIVVQTQITREDGKPAALVTQTQAVISS